MKPATMKHVTRATDTGLIAIITGCWLAGAYPPHWLLRGTFVWAVLIFVLSTLFAIGTALRGTPD